MAQGRPIDGPHGPAAASALAEELSARAVAVAMSHQAERPGRPPSERIDASDRQARRVATALGDGREACFLASVDFLGDAVATLAVDGAWRPGEIREAVDSVARALGVEPPGLRLAVLRRALVGRDVQQLPPQLAAGLLLELLVELSPADAASVWQPSLDGGFDCLASAGDAPTSRRMHAAARAVLAGAPSLSSQIRAVPVERWDRPHAALAVRLGGDPADLRLYLDAAADILSPLLERESLFERNAARERELVSASERRLVRLGLDLHDGPLQELVGFADEVRLARSQVGELVGDGDRARVAGRFDDLEARLLELDRVLREVVHAARPTSAVERPLEHALRTELERLAHGSDVAVDLQVDGDLTELTDSQKITLFRVAQESLSNARKHSGARSVQVRLRGAPGHITLTVSDDGCGFDQAEAARRAVGRARVGLGGVAERVRLLGGDVAIASAPGAGTCVRATLPRWRPARQPQAAVYAVTA